MLERPCGQRIGRLLLEFNRLIPELSVHDFLKSLLFYTKILGFKVEYSRPENLFAMLSLNDAQIMIQQVNNNWMTGDLIYPYGRGVNFQIEVNDVEEIISRLAENNYPVFRSVQTNWYKVDNVKYGNKEFLVQDTDGYLLRFSQDEGILDA